MTPHPPAPGHSTDLIEQLARRDRLFVVAGLLLVTLMAWWYVLAGAGMNMGNLDMSTPMPWSAGYATLVFFMWWIMMVTMMLPSAAPMILLFALVNRRSWAAGAPYVSTAVFARGYRAAWGVFSLLATGAARCPADGAPARCFVCRLLLGGEGPVVIRRCHEPFLDRRHRHAGARGKSVAGRWPPWCRQWHLVYWLGFVAVGVTDQPSEPPLNLQVNVQRAVSASRMVAVRHCLRTAGRPAPGR
jgi:hypothetical protein